MAFLSIGVNTVGQEQFCSYKRQVQHGRVQEQALKQRHVLKSIHGCSQKQRAVPAVLLPLQKVRSKTSIADKRFTKQLPTCTTR